MRTIARHRRIPLPLRMVALTVPLWELVAAGGGAVFFGFAVAMAGQGFGWWHG